jgi:ankyrin repeat protein
MNALVEAVAAGDDARARELARTQPELRDRPGGDGLRPAMHALYRRSRALAEELLPAEDSLTVWEAAAFGRGERLHALLREDGARANALSPDGFTPLHLACFSGGADTARLLVRHGADIEAVSTHVQVKVRPLGTAAFSGDRECARVLLGAGADPNGRAAGGGTPLHTAAQNGDDELVRLLLDRGADPAAELADGRTPYDLARAADHDVCAAALRAAGAAPYN